jgi:hypothetical protein
MEGDMMVRASPSYNIKLPKFSKMHQTDHKGTGVNALGRCEVEIKHMKNIKTNTLKTYVDEHIYITLKMLATH